MKVFLFVALLLAIPYTPIKKYDPGRNADKDIKDAIVEAQRTGKSGFSSRSEETGAIGVTSWMTTSIRIRN